MNKVFLICFLLLPFQSNSKELKADEIGSYIEKKMVKTTILPLAGFTSQAYINFTLDKEKAIYPNIKASHFKYHYFEYDKKSYSIYFDWRKRTCYSGIIDTSDYYLYMDCYKLQNECIQMIGDKSEGKDECMKKFKNKCSEMKNGKTVKLKTEVCDKLF